MIISRLRPVGLVINKQIKKCKLTNEIKFYYRKEIILRFMFVFLCLSTNNRPESDVIKEKNC